MSKIELPICKLTKYFSTMKQFIKKFVGEILLVGGVGLFSYNILGFSYHTSNRRGDYYYYDSNTLLIIVVGAMLIAVGVLIIKNRQKLY